MFLCLTKNTKKHFYHLGYIGWPKNTQKHVFWGLTKNIEKHFYHRASRLPNAPSTAHGARSAAATELRRSRCCDGAAQTSSVALILRVARRVRDRADAAATALMLRAALPAAAT